MKPIQTYWLYSVYAIESDRHRCLVTGHGETIAEAIRSMFRDVTYYQSECGYRVRANLTEECSTCNGSGRVRKARTAMSWKACPTCKGQATRQIIEVPELPADYVATVPA